MQPHGVLPAHYERLKDKPAFVKELFDAGAKHYDSVVNWGFLGSGDSYRKWAMERHGLKPGMRLLDVACGTGLVAAAAAHILKNESAITCLDPSDGMLAVARKKLDATFVRAGADEIPLPDSAFDFLTVGYALRHFGTLDRAFGEFHRVLKPGGKVLILEATKPSGKLGALFFKLYFGRIYPWLTRIFTRSRDAQKMMLYFWETMDACVRPDTVLSALEGAGFTDVRRESKLRLFSEYVATRPAKRQADTQP